MNLFLLIFFGMCVILYVWDKLKHIFKYNGWFGGGIGNINGYRWKSESELYLEFCKSYKKVDYQKTFDWLGKQSLDIYIPSKKIAIEYQGKQHFEGVSIFGGRKGYRKQVKLDRRKRKLCKKHGITLLYFTNEKSVRNRLGCKKVYKDLMKLKNRVKFNFIYRTILNKGVLFLLCLGMVGYWLFLFI